MKSIALSLVLLFAVARGYPQASLPAVGLEEQVSNGERSLVVDVILSTLEGLRQDIIELGLDPLSQDELEVNLTEHDYTSIVDGLLTAKPVASTGLSSFVINRMNFATLTSRLTFELSIPELTFGVGDATFAGKVLGDDADAQASGSVAVFNGRVWGQVRVSVGIITGISIRDLEVNFNLDAIQSNINAVRYNGEDYTEQANDVLGNVVPTFVHENQAVVREWLTAVVQQVIDRIL